MKRIFQISFLVITLSFTIESCTKDVLPDDTNEPIIEYDSLVGLAEGLEGSWEWLYSSGPGGTKYPNFYYSSPQTEGYSLSFEFIERGNYKEYKDGKEVEKGRILITERSGLYWDFNLTLKSGLSKEKWSAIHFIENDSIIISSYPFDNDVDNYFVRK